MKKIITTFIAITYCVLALAQTPTAENSIIEKAEFIFEGHIIDQKSFYDSTMDNNGMVHGNIYNTYIIQIDKIFRSGDKFKSETIVIIDPQVGAGFAVTEYGLMIIDRDIDYSGLPASLPKNGIYFCNTYNDSKMNNVEMFISIHPSIDVTKLELPSSSKNKVKFKSKQEIYEYLEQYKNITIPEEEKQENKTEPVKKKDASGSLNVISKENQIKYAQNVQNYKKYKEFLQSRIAIVANKASNNCKELFISEMIEGTAMNKSVEIFNPTDSPIDLANFNLRIFHNGQLTPIKIPLSGTIASKSTFVIAHPAANNDIKTKADMLDNKMNFDGNDAIVLEKGNGGNYIDKIGEIGVNPGNAGWTCSGGSTKDYTLRRKKTIGKGEMDWQNKCRQQWTDHPKDNSANLKQHQSVCAATTAAEDISFSFANPIETGTTPKYFEFDIMVESGSSDTYLDNCSFFIQYNPSAFGTNVIANGKVTITKGTNFNTVTYDDPNTAVTDDSTVIFVFPFSLDYSQTSWNRTNITISQQQLVHIKMEIQNCNQNSQLEFVKQSTSSNASLYTTFPTADPFTDPFFSYDNTFYLNDLNLLLCNPFITSFTSPVYPGTFYQGTTNTDYLMTIQGANFGASRGNGNVYLKNANNGGQNYTLLDAYDFLSWTDNQIQIRMPSRIDTTLYPSTNRRTPGSGIFYVKTNTGDSVLSNTPIDMPYAIKNVGFPTLSIKKVRMDLINPDTTDSVAITFRLGTSITNTPGAEAVVRKAVRDWRCETLVYFETGTDTNINSSVQDGVSVIHFVNSFPNDSTIALASMYETGLIICLDNNGFKHVFPKEIDIAIIQNPVDGTTWFYDTLNNPLPSNNRDFYEVVLHEVGHGNLLQHVLAPTQAGNINELMFWKGFVGPVAGNDRRFINLDDGDGGFDVVIISNSVVLNTTTCNTPNVGTLNIAPDKTCGSVVRIEEHFSKKQHGGFHIYPNPTGNQGFNISY